MRGNSSDRVCSGTVASSASHPPSYSSACSRLSSARAWSDRLFSSVPSVLAMTASRSARSRLQCSAGCRIAPRAAGAPAPTARSPMREVATPDRESCRTRRGFAAHQAFPAELSVCSPVRRCYTRHAHALLQVAGLALKRLDLVLVRPPQYEARTVIDPMPIVLFVALAAGLDLPGARQGELLAAELLDRIATGIIEPSRKLDLQPGVECKLGLTAILRTSEAGLGSTRSPVRCCCTR